MKRGQPLKRRKPFLDLAVCLLEMVSGQSALRHPELPDAWVLYARGEVDQRGRRVCLWRPTDRTLAVDFWWPWNRRAKRLWFGRKRARWIYVAHAARLWLNP